MKAEYERNTKCHQKTYHSGYSGNKNPCSNELLEAGNFPASAISYSPGGRNLADAARWSCFLVLFEFLLLVLFRQKHDVIHEVRDPLLGVA